nr:MAG TPA: hypothetical protein [Caudoviricetes sp.]
MGYLDYAGLQYLWGKLKEKFAPKSHSHDDRYYTEAEMDGKLNSKVNNNEAGADSLLSKLTTSWTATPTDNTYFIRQDTGGGDSFGRVKFSTLWNYIKGKADGTYQPKGSYAVSGHTHDDRYYTESEMNAKLAEKSNIDHTHNIIKDVGDGRNIKIAYSKSGLDYGNYSWLAGWNGEELRAVNKNQFATADHTHNTSSIGNGNVNYAGWAGPIESAHIDVLRANRLAFLPASGVKVEYSVDSGATWIDYGATDAQKASLFAMRMGHDVAFYTGKHTKADECTTKDQLRITVTPVDRYASVNMLYLWVSVAGTSATVNISRSTIGAKETFTDVRTDVPISGWSGPNEIRFSGGTFGGGSTQTGNAYAYRFTFKNKADGKGSISVMDIRMYGPSAWGVPNNMMEKDHIYNWDANQNVHFPAQVTATKFNGSSTGVVDYGDSNGSTIKVGYQGAGLTRDNLKHIAGYAKDGNQTVIKDVDRGVLQSWLNLNEMINTQLTTGSSTPSDNDFYISQYAGGGATTTTYHRRPISALWNYIKSKADAVYSAKSHTHTKSQITDFPASLKNPTALTIQTNGAIAATYDGSVAKTVNITKGNIGLGNVDNTADANKSVKYATSAGSASTATKAATADSATKANSADYLNFTVGNEINFTGTPSNNIVFLGYRNSSISQYKFCNGDGGGSLATVVAAAFNGKATSAGTADNATTATTSNGVKDYNDANRTIKIGFAGAGLTAENLSHIAGYTDNGTKIKDVSKDVLKSWIGLGNYLPLIGGTMSGQITKSTGGSWIGDRDRAAIKSSYAGDSSYGAVAAMATKNGYWTMGNLGGGESLIFNYSTDANYNAGKNETSQVYLPAQAGTIITSATIGSQSVNYANRAGNSDVANSVDWSKVQNKPSSYAPAAHTHDDRYYTESEVNTKLANYQPKGNYAAAEHTHNYAGSGSAGGSANSAVKLDSSAGSNTQPVYFSGGKPVAIGYTIAKSVPADAKFTDTNTWRGIQNNLTSDSTDQSLSAAQGKALKTLVDGKAPISHTHTKSQITDFPSSMPASDVSAWAKAATKPSYTKAEVGLGNVDNTADKDKNVKFATSAGSATNAQCLNNDDKYMKFHWSGQSGQPTWLWGGNNSGDMYVYNPSNFSVNYAATAGVALTAKNLPYSITYEGSYVGTAPGTSPSTNNERFENYATETNPVKTTLSKEYDVVVFIDAGTKSWDQNDKETCPEKNAFLRLMNVNDNFVYSYVVMGSLTNEWVRGTNKSGGSETYGPVVAHGKAPEKSIKYRKNGTTIERYWTREQISSSAHSWVIIIDGDRMLLDRQGHTYHVFGIDIDHRFFVSSHADEEGSEVV